MKRKVGGKVTIVINLEALVRTIKKILKINKAKDHLKKKKMS
jgi:hypothetical protein